MKVIAMIDADRQPDVVQKILTCHAEAEGVGGRHCGLPAGPKPQGEGWWKDRPKRGPPKGDDAQRPAEPAELVYDDTFFDRECC